MDRALASYLTDPASAQYWLIVDTLLAEQARSLSGVSQPDLEVLLRQPGRPGPVTRPLDPRPLDRRLDQLGAWGVAVQWPGPSGDPVYQLTAAAAQLHQAIRRLGPGPARVAARQGALRRDVDVWGTGVDRHGGPIAARAANLLDAGPTAWRPAALHSLGAAVPEDRLATLLDDYRATLTGLLTWFGPGDNAARQLRRQLRDGLEPRGLRP